MTPLEYAIACYARFCLRAFVLVGEALGDAVLYLASFMPGYNDHQRVTSLVIVLYTTMTAWAVLTVLAVLTLAILEIAP